MKYKNFDSFKINESKIMNSKNFVDFEIDGNFDCEFNIFKTFPKHLFGIKLKSGKVYVYSKDKNRIKYESVEEMNQKENQDVEKYSIIASDNGEFIKQQYEELTNYEVDDVFQFISGSEKPKKKDTTMKKRGYSDCGGDDESDLNDDNNNDDDWNWR